MNLFNNIYHNQNVLLTGHNGFKGSWLSLWLSKLGANVTGISLSVTEDNLHWSELNLDVESHDIDVRDASAINKAIQAIKPSIVFHLAAQSLVRPSYRDPLETWSTNVMGTANVLEACRKTSSVKAVIVVTSDKCYENKEWHWGYRETDRLGGYDPYSASKAGAELVANSYRQSFFDKGDLLLATARAGNVIGGGDWSQDRIVPDVARAVKNKCSLEIRSPNATRPWQHVLESLSGYLLLGQKLLEGKHDFAEAWNFGPSDESNRSVEEMLTVMQPMWPDLVWNISDAAHPHEAQLLRLDSAKANQRLKWQPVWRWDKSIQATAQWYRTYLEQNKIASSEQLDQYINDARTMKQAWAI
ncbi:MAG: CDP-glucose 4,6-dehydratase [Gammaproteobacteria bacterium]|nr:CDP-glucose 4,6-dehydratase [Gammaproteobacteria bacterium]